MQKRVFAAVALLAVLMTFAACRRDASPTQPKQPTIIGKWTAQVDMTDTVNQMIFTQTGVDTATVSFPVVLDLSFLQDGTYTLGVDRVQLDVQIDRLVDVLWQIVVEQAAAQSHMTAAEATEALHAQGKSKDVLLQQLNFASMFENSICQTGVWKQENDLLYFADNADSLADAEGYRILLSDTQLALTYQDTVGTDQEPAEMTITFAKK